MEKFVKLISSTRVQTWLYIINVNNLYCLMDRDDRKTIQNAKVIRYTSSSGASSSSDTPHSHQTNHLLPIHIYIYIGTTALTQLCQKRTSRSLTSRQHFNISPHLNRLQHTKPCVYSLFKSYPINAMCGLYLCFVLYIYPRAHHAVAPHRVGGRFTFHLERPFYI